MNSFNIQQALPLLEQGAILQTTQYPITRLWLNENNIYLSNDHLHAVISIQDFIHTYETYSFHLIPEGVEVIDLKKDEEYYSWKQ
jgi:hypothetical protein